MQHPCHPWGEFWGSFRPPAGTGRKGLSPEGVSQSAEGCEENPKKKPEEAVSVEGGAAAEDPNAKKSPKAIRRPIKEARASVWEVGLYPFFHATVSKGQEDGYGEPAVSQRKPKQEGLHSEQNSVASVEKKGPNHPPRSTWRRSPHQLMDQDPPGERQDPKQPRGFWHPPSGALGIFAWRIQTPSTRRLRSKERTECVRAPTEIRSTPVPATWATFWRRMPPLASTRTSRPKLRAF